MAAPHRSIAKVVTQLLAKGLLKCVIALDVQIAEIQKLSGNSNAHRGVLFKRVRIGYECNNNDSNSYLAQVDVLQDFQAFLALYQGPISPYSPPYIEALTAEPSGKLASALVPSTLNSQP